MHKSVIFCIIFNLGLCLSNDVSNRRVINFKHNPPASGRRCGVCPTYIDKICAFDTDTNSTFIFDNACILDLWNCIRGSNFIVFNYEHCVFFGNFAYVHGSKYEDEDYGEEYLKVLGSKISPHFVD